MVEGYQFSVCVLATTPNNRTLGTPYAATLWLKSADGRKERRAKNNRK